MEQLTLEQASQQYIQAAYYRGRDETFKAGANWQKEQDKELMGKLANALSVAINATPSGAKRNELCDINIQLLEKLQS